MADARECGRCGAAESELNPFQKWRKRCIPCHRAEMREYRRRYEQTDKGKDATRRYRSKATTVTWAAKNPERQRELRQAWKRRNPDAVRADTNRRRARLVSATGTHTDREWQRLKARFGGLCYYCRQAPATTRDHVVPLSRGGSDSIGNILPACLSCNSRKHSRTIMEWRVRLWRMGMADLENLRAPRPRAGQGGTHAGPMAVLSRS